MIENIIIGKPLVDEYLLFAPNEVEWFINEIRKTAWDEERFLPKLLVKYNFMKSISEVKRNRQDLWITLDKIDFLQFKIGQRKIWICVGE